MSARTSVATIGFLSIFGWAGGIGSLEAQTGESVKPAEATDRWAGKSLLTTEHVQGMITGRLLNAPRQGEKAPPFALRDAQSKKILALGDLHRSKPIVLFFGSRSCSVTQRSSQDVVNLWRQYGKSVDFYLIYIREAHPKGSRAFAGEMPFVADDPPTNEAREVAALEFAKEKGIEFPVLVDRTDDTAAVRWGAWPVRLFLIDTTGTVVFAGQQGPWFHRPTDDYDPGVSNVPNAIRDLPGYSRGSLEDALKKRFSGQKSGKTITETGHGETGG